MRAAPSLQRRTLAAARCQRATCLNSDGSHPGVALYTWIISEGTPGVSCTCNALGFGKSSKWLLTRADVNYRLMHVLSNSVMARQGRSPPDHRGSEGVGMGRVRSWDRLPSTLGAENATARILR